MRILIGVSNFGKIKSAEIDVSNFAVFVGENDTGKSSLLMLTYGLLQRLPKLEILVDDYEITENTKIELERGTEWFSDYEKKVNMYLDKNKENIIEDIFRRPISIGSIYIKIADIDEKIKIQFNGQGGPENTIDNSQKDSEYPKKSSRIQLYIEKQRSETNEILYSSRVSFTINQSKEFIKLYVEREVTGLIWNLFMGRKEVLFLPDSKAGIQLLYKYFFAEREKKPTAKSGRNKEKVQENELKLPSPVYDFFEFLLKYTPNNKAIKDNSKLIAFIEGHLINGRLQQKGDETVYIHEDTDKDIPLYACSSAINELAPIIKALTGAADYQYFFYDAVETCLDLRKQKEMARLLMRLNNSGKRLIISTHSDTMTSEINQLVQLSHRNCTEKEKQKKLDKLNLTDEDLPKSENIHIYQFLNQGDGTSVVNELKPKDSFIQI